MSFNQLSGPRWMENDMLTIRSHDLTVDEWIYLDIPCLLLYKDGFMDIYPAQEYTSYELTMLQKDSKYKSSWIPIRYGSFLQMQECMYEIARHGLCTIDAK